MITVYLDGWIWEIPLTDWLTWKDAETLSRNYWSI